MTNVKVIKAAIVTCLPPLTSVRPFQLLAAQSGTLSQISSKNRPSVQTVSDVCLIHTCSLDTSAFSVLKVLDNITALYKLTYLLTFTVNYMTACNYQCCK